MMCQLRETRWLVSVVLQEQSSAIRSLAQRQLRGMHIHHTDQAKAYLLYTEPPSSKSPPLQEKPLRKWPPSQRVLIDVVFPDGRFKKPFPMTNSNSEWEYTTSRVSSAKKSRALRLQLRRH